MTTVVVLCSVTQRQHPPNVVGLVAASIPAHFRLPLGPVAFWCAVVRLGCRILLRRVALTAPLTSTTLTKYALRNSAFHAYRAAYRGLAYQLRAYPCSRHPLPEIALSLRTSLRTTLCAPAQKCVFPWKPAWKPHLGNTAFRVYPPVYQSLVYRPQMRLWLVTLPATIASVTILKICFLALTNLLTCTLVTTRKYPIPWIPRWIPPDGH